MLAVRSFSGLSPLDEDEAWRSRECPLLGQSGLDDIMLPEAGRGGSMLGGVRPRGGPGGGAEEGGGGGGWSMRR